MGITIGVVRVVLIISLLGGICGCALTPPTADGVRAMGPERQIVFIAPENYQPVYRKILDEARRCFQFGVMSAQGMVQGDIFQDTRSGRITHTMVGGFGNQTFEVIDVVAIDNNQTRVVGHYVHATESASKYHAEALKKWVLDNTPMCER